MATFQRRRRADGTLVWRAIVRKKEHGAVVYSETRSFTEHRAATRWAKKLEQALEDPAWLASRKLRGITVGSLIGRYIDYVDGLKPLGRTKRYVLELLAGEAIAEVEIQALTSAHVLEHAKSRREDGAGPATIAQDMIYLRGVLALAKPAWGLPVTPQPVDEAMPMLRQLGLVEHSKRRDRRPVGDEIDRLMADFARTQPNSTIPMADIVDFALWTARRQGEICRVRWEDYDPAAKTLIVRDMKDPRRKAGNDFRFPLLGDAAAIIERQPRIDERIFPYNPDSVASRFERARDRLEILDLRFHDLRREAASRLFERGYQIHEVAQVTGHRDLNTLWKIYTKLHPEKFQVRPDSAPSPASPSPASHPAASPDRRRAPGAAPSGSRRRGRSEPEAR